MKNDFLIVVIAASLNDRRGHLIIDMNHFSPSICTAESPVLPLAENTNSILCDQKRLIVGRRPIRALGADSVAAGTIAFLSPGVNSRQHQHLRIDIVVATDNMLRIVKPMETANILLQRSLPGNRRRQVLRVQTRVIKSFTNVAARCQDDSWIAPRNSRNGFRNRPALFLAHATS